jgi:hypothetical protein
MRFNRIIIMVLHHILPLLSLAICHPAAYRIWGKLVRYEVADNAASIKANGSADNLRKGYHQRRAWLRFWPLLGLAVGAALPLWGHWLAAGLAFLALAILLTAYFARFFTPLLNLARGLPEFKASSDSASWPDAAVWKQVRGTAQPGIYDRQPLANDLLKRLLARVWLWGRLTYAVLLAATLFLLFHY